MALVRDPTPTLSCYDEAFIDVNHASVVYDCEYLQHHHLLLEECMVGSQSHPWELPMTGGLGSSSIFAQDSCRPNMGGGIVSSSSPSSSVITFDSHGDEYCAAWTDGTNQPAYGLAPAHAAASAVGSSSFSFRRGGASSNITGVAASQKRHRVDEPSTDPGADQEDVAAPKKQCSSKRRAATTKLNTVPLTKDPQNIAAKNRREKISERLRALQELVPNGSKVDTVTMLDKAITYVKFMQLQLKVLETDAFWPTPGGEAPKMSQVEEALNAILRSTPIGLVAKDSPIELAQKRTVL